MSESVAMRMRRWLERNGWGLLLIAGMGSGLFEPARAEAAGGEFVDPPGRVARVSFIDGAVSIAPAMSDEWGEAVLNRPLTSGDRVWVDAGGRTELEVGSATIRLDGTTGFSFVNLTDAILQMRLTGGVMTLRVYTLPADSIVEITTPNTTVTVVQPGEYTIETVEAGGQTIVKTRSGEATVAGGQQAFGVAANEQGVFSGDPELIAEITAVEPRTQFEDWAYARDAREVESVTARYVAPEVVGYRELDTYGTWYNEPEYGNVWRPTYVVADWAPYRYGRWTWVSPWGWTWIDDAPWGFAPSHYGRWSYLRQRWCWVPGPRHLYPVYAPALVGWVGDPYYGVGNVGWFPLAPRETYLPGYRSSWRHFNNVNVSNTWIVNNTYINNAYYGRGGPIDYRNRHLRDATTVVHRDTFVSARRIGDHRPRIDAGDLRRWPAQGRPPTILPGRDSIVGERTNTRPRSPQADRWAAADRDARQRGPNAGERAGFAPSRPRDQRPAADVSQRPAAAGTGAADMSNRSERSKRSTAHGNAPIRAHDARQSIAREQAATSPQTTVRTADQRRNDRPAGRGTTHTSRSIGQAERVDATTRSAPADTPNRRDRPESTTARGNAPIQAQDSRQSIARDQSRPSIQTPSPPTGQRRNERPARPPAAGTPGVPSTQTAQMQRRQPSTANHDAAPIQARQADRPQRLPPAHTGTYRRAPSDNAPIRRADVATRPAPEVYQRHGESRSAYNALRQAQSAPPVSAPAPQRPQTAPLEQRAPRTAMDAPAGGRDHPQRESNTPRNQDAPRGAQAGERGYGFGSRQQSRSDQR
jgi:hypothetical protein